ncbi:Hsp20/alpha crystallin family protein [Sphingobium herbicidovorans NBRC 16415]|uniref:Hsp20/alpha crystallin family protein n=1 Tax=Sphingobium herbicidovorans (strain ATCC 700291 / DSM 11019 / CCUG 56400 / KCTC 2939 / LMG 18315 / NBRC 16415 / MH) TaxID=1219045 RepID=A0A086P4U3_SPHHM|nr:Hsp20/alpha crystallin family protein [Sphingobium herbicidovorans NBRC 16415]
MATRDFIPWRRQENTVPAMYHERDLIPFTHLRREIDRLTTSSARPCWAEVDLAVGGRAGPAWRSRRVKTR